MSGAVPVTTGGHTDPVSPDPVPGTADPGGDPPAAGTPAAGTAAGRSAAAAGAAAGGSGPAGPRGSGYWNQGPPDPGQPWSTGLPPPHRPARPDLPSVHLPAAAGRIARAWWPETLAVVTVLTVFFAMDVGTSYYYPGATWPVLLAAMAAAGCSRRQPGTGLAVLTITIGLSLLSGVALYAQFATGSMVAFGCARYGSRGLRWLTGSIIAALPIVGLLALGMPYVDIAVQQWNNGGPIPVPWRQLLADSTGPGLAWALLLVLPWTIGRFGRSLEASREREEAAQEQRALAERERGYAQQVAELKAGQAQLARDVHDVVGHSLAVILAQAQSAQYLGDDEVDKMRETLANVATSARRSLQDVRHVLQPSATGEQPPATGLDALIDGVSTAGNDVRRHVVGTPRPLPPDLEQVAYRVLQEMLTNALKHGRRGGPVWVEQEWPADWRAAHLRLTVRNLLDAEATGPLPTARPGGGLGVESMRYRVESVGGHLVTDVEPDAGGRVFTATAWLPLRATEVTPEGE